ncbi:MAG: DNA-processing protein DprA, partial [Desulfobacteraceae bacterium]
MEHLVPWLSLKSVSGIGDHLFYRLISHFGTPERVLQASTASLQQVDGITARLAASITGHRPADDLFKEIEQCGRKGFHIITLHDSHYPALLLQLPDPPPYLYCYGTLAGDDCHIAVVGSRKASNYGKSCAKRLGQELAQNGVSVVSGMATGIDTAAHAGALTGGGKTIAVLGSGLNRIYPASNRKLFHSIAENGAVLSEFALNSDPLAHHFPKRNRIISGMALGTVVVEAAKRSGSLITARLAAEQGREVYAVPGSIYAATARGTHHLIKQGAKLVETAQDILEEVAPQMEVLHSSEKNVAKRPPASDKATSMSKLEIQLLEAMSPYPVHIDVLARQCNQQIGTLTATLC